MSTSPKSQNPKPLDPNDPRLQHLRSHDSFDFVGPVWDYTDHVLDVLAPRPGTVVIYHFDGELDDKLRLEHLLLHWSSPAELLILAGQRLGGDDTFEELSALMSVVLKCSAIPGGRFTSRYNIRLLRGGPLTSVNESTKLPDAKKVRQLQIIAKLLASYIGNRPFVYHNNTSFSLLDNLLRLPVAKQLKGCTFTCATARVPKGFYMGANAKWDEDAFARVLEYAKKPNAPPFVTLYGQNAGWKRKNLDDLRKWTETVLAPAASELDAAYSRKIVRFGIGLALRWSIAGYANAKHLTGPQTTALVDSKLNSIHCNMQPGRPRPSDEWATLCLHREEAWANLDPMRDAFRFEVMASKLEIGISNTVGDLSGCVFDVPRPKKNMMIILKIDKFIDKGLSEKKVHLGYRARFGQSAYKPTGGLHILAFADEWETLDTAWASIRISRTARKRAAARTGVTQKTFPILDAQLSKEWLLWKSIFEFFLRGTLENVGIFPKESKAILERAVDNLENGTMVRLCKAMSERQGSSPSSRRASRSS